MTIENLKQIAIKYATTKGSRVPLAPDELCNAVVQYFNEFLKITADINTIQVAVTEEGGNIVFTITGNTLDGKAFTPIVITVDHNDFVTNQEFEEFKTSVTKQLNNKRSVISSPASSYVVYTQANGLESNLPYSELANQTSTNIMARRANGTSDVKKGISGENVANMENIADLEEKIPDVTNLATKDELNNKLNKSNWSATVYIVDSNSIQNNVEYTSNPSPNTFVYRDDYSNFVVNSPTENGNPTPKSYVDNALAGKLDKVISTSDFARVYMAQTDGSQQMINVSYTVNNSTLMQRGEDGRAMTAKGVSGQDIANMENIADVEAKIPDVSGFATTEQLQEVENKIPDTSNLATKTELQEVESKIPDTTNFTEITTFNKRVYFKEIHFEDNDYNIYNTYANNQGIFSKYVADVSENIYNIKELGLYYYCLGTVTNDGMFHEFLFPNEGGTLALTSDIPAIPEYTSVDSVIYDTTNGAIIAYNGANEIHIPLLAGENVTIDASEDNKKIVISAAGGGGTVAGNNTFTGENTFNNSIYAKNGVVVGDTTNYGANSVTKGSNTYSFPNKSGTFAMTTDIIPNPIYFISFYANDPSETCRIIGTMMSKNSYGTGQKTNEEFAVMLSDNLYTNSNEGLAAYGKLAQKDILCIYSEDGLSIRCLDEENSEFDLPTIIFFVMETEL